MQSAGCDSSMPPEPQPPSACINPNLLGVTYAVRGPIVERALQLQKELQKVGIIKINVSEKRLYALAKGFHCFIFEGAPSTRTFGNLFNPQMHPIRVMVLFVNML